MSNPGNDNRLEQLSREAASGYTPPGNASWEKMEAALDKVMPVAEKRKRRIIFWWFFPLLIAGAGSLYLLWPSPQPVSPTPASIIKISSPAPTADISQKEQSTIVEKESIQTEKKATNSEPVYNSILKKNRINDQKTTTVQTNKLATGSSWVKPLNNISADRKTETIADNKQLESVTDAPVQKTVEAVTKNSSAPITTVNTIQTGTDSGNTKPTTSIIEKTDTVSNETPLSSDSLNRDSTISNTKKTALSKFSIAFVAGMDASTVKFKHSDKAGINIGILAGYHFNNQLSVHTGVLFTKKNYTVAGEDFTAPKGSWVANYKLTMVDGYCNMWEVPLLLRYQFNGTGNRSFFLSGGISSYFMTRENYNYSYYWNGQPVTRNSNYPDGNTHLLSILRLSGGWRKAVGKSSSVLIEPYAALPLGGLGYGSIRLSSFGLNFSLQIRQPSKNK